MHTGLLLEKVLVVVVVAVVVNGGGYIARPTTARVSDGSSGAVNKILHGVLTL